MKYKKFLMVASMVLLMFGCKMQTSSGEPPANTAPEPIVAAETVVATPSASQLLEPKLKKGMPYADLRKIVLADGWLPLKTEACKENVGGEAAICDERPEVEACSGDGHCNMFFVTSDGNAKLRVGTYDDSVVSWEFPTQVNASAEKSLSWDAVISLSEEECTQKGYWSFFEAFVKSDAIKKSHASPQVQVWDYRTKNKVADKFSVFKIGLVDNIWVFLEPGKDVGNYDRLTLKENLTGNEFRVDYQKAEFSGDDEVVKNFGKPGAYVFEMQNGCWQLTKEYR